MKKKIKYGVDRIKRLKCRKRSGEFILQFKNDKVALCPNDWVLLFSKNEPIICQVKWIYRYNFQFKSLRVKRFVPEYSKLFLLYKVSIEDTYFVAFLPQKITQDFDNLEFERYNTKEGFYQLMYDLWKFVKWAISFRKLKHLYEMPDFEMWIKDLEKGEEAYYEKMIEYDDLEGIVNDMSPDSNFKDYLIKFYILEPNISDYPVEERKKARKLARLMNHHIRESWRWLKGNTKRKKKIDRKLVEKVIYDEWYLFYQSDSATRRGSAYLAKQKAIEQGKKFWYSGLSVEEFLGFKVTPEMYAQMRDEYYFTSI